MDRIEKINRGVIDHLTESFKYFPEEKVVGCFLQGSQNYELDYEESDIDTKLIIIPSLKDICLNKKPISTTHVRENNEHTDWKDIRLYMETFRKQNLNFLEILFTDFYYIIDIEYKYQWNRLLERREAIAHMNEFRAVKSMKGHAMQKYVAMEKSSLSRADIVAKYGYDGKQVSHLIRIEDYLKRYINGEKYKKCLIPTESKKELIMDYKLNKVPLNIARIQAFESMKNIEKMEADFCEGKEDLENPEIRELLDDVCYNIVRASIKKELKDERMPFKK